MLDMIPSKEPKRPWPSKGMWVPGKAGAAPCQRLQPCKGETAYADGEACNLCGMFRDGSLD